MKRLDFDALTKCVTWNKQDYYVREMTRAILSGSPDSFLMIPDADYNEAMEALEARRIQDELLNNTMRRNNEGIELEDEGRTDEAIALYEQNVEAGYPATHSYERLMVLYRKRKEYEQEARVIRRAIEVYSSTSRADLIDKYNKRLCLVTELLSKSVSA